MFTKIPYKFNINIRNTSTRIIRVYIPFRQGGDCHKLIKFSFNKAEITAWNCSNQLVSSWISIMETEDQQVVTKWTITYLDDSGITGVSILHTIHKDLNDALSIEEKNYSDHLKLLLLEKS